MAKQQKFPTGNTGILSLFGSGNQTAIHGFIWDLVAECNQSPISFNAEKAAESI